MKAPNAARLEIAKLIERFDLQGEALHRSPYNEEQLRIEFINPFFNALGWDVENKAGTAEPYKDVIHEDAIKIGGGTKAPDYCFRMGGARVFFLETKMPGKGIKDNQEYAYQLRSYAWSAKLPLSILSNFEEMAVYDCRIKPHKNDKASTGRIFYFQYRDYLEHLDEFYSIFSREAVRTGLFDQFARSTKPKKGTAEVDDAFLEEIETWRKELAKNIALRNPRLSQRELNFAVQATVDRIIFLRICEDRGIESYGQLESLQNGPRVYQRLFELFQKADDRYNSGLFYFGTEKGRGDPDRLTPGLAVDDKPLKEILRSLYYPESPYRFSVLPADILGQVYEQFLGKVIRLTAGHQAKVEEKPEVKKAGGVYYTPTLIVDYIVQHTVGKLVEGKTPREVSGPRGQPAMRVLDPACGSGSFLLGAYQFLLDWYRDRYLEEGPEKRQKEICQARTGDWRLTTLERKRILLTHIFGVDIDPQAVEVTKLSLLLKVLEGENADSLAAQLKIFRERALPDLSQNIQCGNSLIGPDFDRNHQMNFLDEEERYRINAFDWKTGFPEVFSGENPGFHAVIGNPPYVAHQLSEREKDYFNRSYQDVMSGRTNLYALFIRKAADLLRHQGLFGFINPKTFLTDAYFKNLRQIMAKKYSIKTIVNIKDRRSTFQGVLQAVVILIMKRDGASARGQIEILEVDQAREIPEGGAQRCSVPWSEFCLGETFDHLFILAPSRLAYSIIAKMRKRPAFLPEISEGAATGAIQWDLYKEYLLSRPGKNAVRLFWAENLQRYSLQDSKRRRAMQWLKAGAHLPKTPLTDGVYLCTQRVTADEQPRRIIATLLAIPEDSEPCLFENHTNTIRFERSRGRDALAILGLLNSKLFDFYFRRISSNTQVSAGQLNQLPLRDPRTIPSSLPAAVEELLQLQKRMAKARLAHERTMLSRQIEAKDQQIDQQVYELYGLTKDEIAVVEEA